MGSNFSSEMLSGVYAGLICTYLGWLFLHGLFGCFSCTCASFGFDFPRCFRSAFGWFLGFGTVFFGMSNVCFQQFQSRGFRGSPHVPKGFSLRGLGVP